MPNKFEIRYLPAAQGDLISILDWIAQDNPSRAQTFIGTIDKKIGNLSLHPQMGLIPRNEKLRELGYRVLVLGDYLVFYIIHGQTVVIQRVLHGSREYSDIL
jgi:addiction module RelE/StbE family toxin